MSKYAWRFAQTIGPIHRQLSQLTFDEPGSDALGAWFLGPRGENEKLFARLIQKTVADHCQDRRDYFPGDPKWVTDEIKESEAYKEAAAHLEAKLDELLERLDGSVPFFSYRYQAHMLWDVTLPAVLGYFAAMLYNQNNVAAEASPVTTVLEQIVGDDLCRMLGYKVPPTKDGDSGEIAWGHITCDGSVANAEALWAARNLKCYPLAVAAALKREKALEKAMRMKVLLPDGGTGVITELDTWQLLNLDVDEVLALPERIREEFGLDAEATDLIESYTVQSRGMLEFWRWLAPTAHDPVVLAPATAHYSFPKSAALLGIGRSHVIRVPVDEDARMDAKELEARLDRCLAERRPVLMVAAVIGTTEHSAVDPLEEVLKLREAFRRRGLEFWVHADAAWGGYFASMLREHDASVMHTALADAMDEAVGNDRKKGGRRREQVREFPPELHLSEHVIAQYQALPKADSITLDPHKAGYIPYPAGGLCYRNSSMRHLVAFTSPVVYHGGIDPTVGVYGIEGSKPGAAAAATYLSHRVIRPDKSGYGRILGRSMFNSKRLYAALVTLAETDDPFKVVMMQRLPTERKGRPEKEVEEERAWIRKRIVERENGEILDGNDPEALERLKELGGDQLILAYAFNRDVDKLNALNKAIFERLSIRAEKSETRKVPIILTASEFGPADYGPVFMESFRSRLGVEGGEETPIDFLISTTMDPWLTDTAKGNFIPTLMSELRKVVREVIHADPASR